MAEPALDRRATTGMLRRWLDSDLWFSFTRSPVTVVAALVTLLYLVLTLFGPWIAPHDPFDMASLDLMESFTPPAWEVDGLPQYLLGTDDQGRDLLSAIIYGARISLFIGVASVLLSLAMGVVLGLLAGFLGGMVDAFIMRVAEVQLSFPAILIALLVNGVLRGVSTLR